jgi:hypothetical protein
MENAKNYCSVKKKVAWSVVAMSILPLAISGFVFELFSGFSMTVTGYIAFALSTLLVFMVFAKVAHTAVKIKVDPRKSRLVNLFIAFIPLTIHLSVLVMSMGGIITLGDIGILWGFAFVGSIPVMQWGLYCGLFPATFDKLLHE